MPSFSPQHPVAFFCAEFGIQSNLPIYAGGLGVLAGDILKEAADQKIPMVGVGLLYRGEGAVQVISEDGRQEEADDYFDPIERGLEQVFVDEMPLFIKVHLTEVDIWVRCWKKEIGDSVVLYLLDTDTEQNHLHERGIAHALYAGTEEELIKQQLVLSIGGVKLLHALGIHPSVYHLNEGRPAFLHWQLIRSYMDEHGLSYPDAVIEARNKTVYTNHTLVEAGNQSYTSDLLKIYGAYYAHKMGIAVETLLAPGLDPATGRFSITRYALNTSCLASAVSQLHFQFCQKHWPNYKWIGITNGVYLPFWQEKNVAQAVNPDELWQAHRACKKQLSEYIQNRTGFYYNPEALVITWSRRMAGYKQVESLFADVNRLRTIMGSENRPVQLLIAGKAHVYDVNAKEQIQTVIQYMKNELSGFALFIPNLDIELDQMLVRGSDLWLNTPKFGQEASGTSGMKALSNGVLQCTVADGWANEVDWKETGWMLDHNNLGDSLYVLLESEIIPQFYSRDAQGIPQDWTKKMSRSIQIAQRFSATRMMKEYQEKFYSL